MEKKELSPMSRILSGILLGGFFACQDASAQSTGISHSGPVNSFSHTTPDYTITIPKNGPGTGARIQSVAGRRVDFSQFFMAGKNTTGHLRYGTFVSPRLSTHTVKYMDIKQYQSGSAGRCWEYAMAIDGNRDWILFANIGSASAPTWTTLSDDVTGRAPAARLWIQGSVSTTITRLRLATYSETDNQTKGNFYVADLGATSQAVCENTPYSVLRLINSTVSIKQGS